jgi:hypothetical protein
MPADKHDLTEAGGTELNRKRRAGKTDRRHRRFDIPGVFGSMRTSVKLEIMDISASGMRVSTSQYLVVGKSYPFTLQLDDNRFPVSAQVKWCVLSGSRKVTDDEFNSTYIAGISFENLPNGCGDGLMGFLETCIELEVDTGMFGLFQVSDSNSAIADLDFEFVVKRISLTGMLIESDFAPLVGASFDMDLDLPSEILKAKGRVVFVKKSKRNAQLTELGVEFVDLDEKQTSILRDYLETEFVTQDATLD